MPFGFSFKLRGAPTPKLIPLDPGYNTIEFQFAPDDLVRNVGSTWGEHTAFGRSGPIYQFASGQAQTLEFSALFFAETRIDSIESKIEALIQSCLPDSKLGRPPIWQFTWGGFIDQIVFVESAGGIRYNDVRSNFGTNFGIDVPNLPFLNSGTGLRSVTCNLVLRKYEDFEAEVATIPGAPEQDTFFYTVKSGDTWESIADRFYNDGLQGVFLARLNLSVTALTVGTRVVLPRPAKLRGLVLAPVSIPMRRTEAANSTRRDLYENRSVTRKSYLLRK